MYVYSTDDTFAHIATVSSLMGKPLNYIRYNIIIIVKLEIYNVINNRVRVPMIGGI